MQAETTGQAPMSARDAVAAWDRGDVLRTVEMGGIGPGYEQVIQMAAIEIVRDNLGADIPDFAADDEAARGAWLDWGETTFKRIDSSLGGMTGAQAGAAKNLAYRALRDGWDGMVDSAPKDRVIFVSRAWPKLPSLVEVPA